MRCVFQSRYLQRAARASVAALCFSVVVSAQSRPAQPRFTRERTIVTGGAGPHRLAIDVTLLEHVTPFRVVARAESSIAENGASDLRLFDAQNRPVQYLLVSPPVRQPAWSVGRVLPIAATKKTSGFEVDLGDIVPVDMVRLDGIPAPFLKRLVLEGSGDRTRWTMLAAEGTLFDLPDERLRETQLAFERGPYRYLRVTWDDTNSGRVAPPKTAFARRAVGPPPPSPLRASLSVERRPSEPARSRYRIRLPAARLPVVALELEVRGGHVFRPALVNESRFSGSEAVPAQLGSATLRRVVRDDMTAQAVRIPITPPTEAELELVVEDGSNAPLDFAGIAAVFAELPWIYFEAPEGNVIARYGDPTAVAPRYDLEATRDSVDLARVREARWDASRSLTDPEAATAAPALPETGAAIDGTPFRHVRDIPGDSTGLVALRLDAQVLSQSRGPERRFADLRILDSANRQIPYLLERQDEPLSVEVTPAAVAAEQLEVLKSARAGNRSWYLLRLPFEPLPTGSFALETSARIFQRTIELGIVQPPDRSRRAPSYRQLAATPWRHTDQQSSAPALTLGVPPVATTDLFLGVDEGDNASLPITSVRLLLPSYRVRFFHPAGAHLRLAYGRDDLAPPRYDLALLAPQVMGAVAKEIAAGEKAAAGPDPAAALISPSVFWAFLGVAVVGLLALIVRLVKSNEGTK